MEGSGMTSHIACWWGPKNQMAHPMGMRAEGASEYCEIAYTVRHAVDLMTLKLGEPNPDIERARIATNKSETIWVSWDPCDCDNEKHGADEVESVADKRKLAAAFAQAFVDTV